jgi:sulfatase maturation enzyme AslB (radical SAM superfamily)
MLLAAIQLSAIALNFVSLCCMQCYWHPCQNASCDVNNHTEHTGQKTVKKRVPEKRIFLLLGPSDAAVGMDLDTESLDVVGAVGSPRKI